jgi:hypothetical protein
VIFSPQVLIRNESSRLLSLTSLVHPRKIWLL